MLSIKYTKCMALTPSFSFVQMLCLFFANLQSGTPALLLRNGVNVQALQRRTLEQYRHQGALEGSVQAAVDKHPGPLQQLPWILVLVLCQFQYYHSHCEHYCRYTTLPLHQGYF